MKAAAIQMTSVRDVAANLAVAERFLGEAAEAGAELAVLPENFSFMGATDAERVAAAEEFGDGTAQRFLATQARRNGLTIVGGTIPIRDGGELAASRSLVYGPDGSLVAHYDKIHLFDVDIPGRDERYAESATTLPGTRPVVARTAAGRIGLTVCYDIRFPALFHRLGVQGAEVLAIPAAFTVPTGRVHWQPLLQARAIESLVYVVAAGQCGEHAGGRRTYGHSMIVGPWGEILAERVAGPGLVCADLDIIGLEDLRAKFPALAHRREL
jgi:nitrilase